MRRKLWLWIILGIILSPLAVARQQVHSEGEYQQFLPMVVKIGYYYLPLVMSPPVPPAYTTSYYMKTVDTVRLYNMGCEAGLRDQLLAGKQESVIVLDFGAPTFYNNEYGTRLFAGYGYVNTVQLGNAIKEFGRGYYVCTGADMESHLTIGIGTTNYPLENFSAIRDETRAFSHGQAWAAMVNEVNAWFVSNGYSAQVAAWGANDMELGWNSFALTKKWIEGYASANEYALLDFGDAQGCPTRLAPAWKCSSKYADWTPAPPTPNQENVWFKAYGAGPNYPLPLIYAVSGVNARQWAYLSLYSYNQHGYRMEITGSFTQWQACQQAYPECEGNLANPDDDLDNTPEDGWNQLQFEVNYWPQTAQVILWSTDIKWMVMTTLALVDANLAGLLMEEREPAWADPGMLVQALADPQLDETMRQSLAEKVKMAEKLAADRALGRSKPADKDAAAGQPALRIADPEPVYGLYPGGDAYFHAWQAEITSHWVGEVDGVHTVAYAGARGSDPEQGLVVIVIFSADRSEMRQEWRHAPQNLGALRILEVKEQILWLTNDAGQILQFDLRTGDFLP